VLEPELESEFVPDEVPLLPSPLPLLDPEFGVPGAGVGCVPPEPAEVRGLDAAVDCTPGRVDGVAEELEAAVPGGSGLNSTPWDAHIDTRIARTAANIKALVLTSSRDHPRRKSYSCIPCHTRLESSRRLQGHHKHNINRPYPDVSRAIPSWSISKGIRDEGGRLENTSVGLERLFCRRQEQHELWLTWSNIS
jgi:hypothetical protein